MDGRALAHVKLGCGRKNTSICCDCELAIVVIANCACQQIGRADKVRNKAIVGKFVNFGWGADLNKLSFVHHCDPRGKSHGFFLVMGHNDKGDTHFILNVHQLKLGLFSQLFVQGTKGLIQQEKLRLFDQRTGQRDPLALPTRKLMGFAFSIIAEVYEFENI